MKLEQGQRVGVKRTEHKDGKPQRVPAKFFGDVVRVDQGGETGYVKLDGQDEDTFFHGDELEPEPKPEPAPKKK
jgi:hypothetical protein